MHAISHDFVHHPTPGVRRARKIATVSYRCTVLASVLCMVLVIAHGWVS